MIYLRECFVRRIPSAYRVFAFEFLQHNYVPHKIYALLSPLFSPSPPHNMSSPHMYIFWHLSCRACDSLSWQPWDRLRIAAGRTRNIQWRVAIKVLLLQFRYNLCLHLLLSYIVYNTLLVLVHAPHSAEKPSLCIVTYAFYHVTLPVLLLEWP